MLDFQMIAQAALSAFDTLIASWLPGGVRRGDNYFAAKTTDGGVGDSLSVSRRTGLWMHGAAGASGGDLISLYAYLFDVSQLLAAKAIAQDLNIRVDDAPSVFEKPAVAVPPPKQAERKWQAISPVPINTPATTFYHYEYGAERREHIAEYRLDGELFGYVVRIAKTGGGKEVLPHVWAFNAEKNEYAWKWQQMPKPAPLYLPLHTLAADKTIVVVEGERKADVLQALLEQGAPGIYVVCTWPGGAKRWPGARWDWLQNRSVLLWPDCDSNRKRPAQSELRALATEAERAALCAAQPYLSADVQPGLIAMQGIGSVLRDMYGCYVQMLPCEPPGVMPPGWDCADAIEKDGWDFARVQAFFAQGRQFLDEVAAEVGGKKNDRLGEPKPNDAGGAGKRGGGGRAGGDEEFVDDERWLSPFWNDKQSRWNATRQLVIAALSHDKQLAGIVAWDELRCAPVARRAWPWGAKAGELTDATDLRLNQYLSETYGMPAIARAALEEGLLTVADMNRFHPVREWISAQAWDDKPRLDKWLVHVLGYDPEVMKPDLHEYLSLVGRLWLVAMVKRVFEPGCKFDYMPVLEGQGGLGKSTLLRVLASDAYFSDTHIDVSRGKDALEQLAGLWLLEIGELAGIARAEVEIIKQFISSPSDRYRAAYGRAVLDRPRQLVVCGTTNRKQYLRDTTGNRKFWPIPCVKQIKTDWLSRYRGVLFAEAYQAYLGGAVCYPTLAQEECLFVPMQAARVEESVIGTKLFALLTRNLSAPGLGKLSSLTVFVRIDELVEALGTDAGKSSPQQVREIKAWLEQEAWVRVKRQVDGARHWGYERPLGWPIDDGLNSDETAQAAPPINSEDDDDIPF